MLLADAQALVEIDAAHFAVHEPEPDMQALNTLARGCQRFSPFVAIEQREQDSCLLIDATGGTHLFGGPHRLTMQIAVYLQEQGYFSQVALANSIGSAWAIARFGHCTGQKRSLQRLPVAALRLPADVVTKLHQFDIRRIGQVMALPKESLPSRFGSILTERLSQFCGTSTELLEAIKTPDPIIESWVTDYSISDRAAVALICRQLVESICKTLSQRAEGLLRLEMFFFGTTDELTIRPGDRQDEQRAEPVCLELALVSPVNNSTYLDTLLTLRLERQRLPQWIHCIEARATWTAPLEIRQQTLFADPGEHASDIAGLLNHLTARLGSSVVVRPELQNEVEPERAVSYLPVSSSTQPKQPTVSATTMESVSAWVPTSSRPLQLFEHPQPVKVPSTRSDGAPEKFIWKGRHFLVHLSTRPERIQTAWWREQAVCRDYYRIESRSGQRFWLFRDQQNRWFLHGVFA